MKSKFKILIVFVTLAFSLSIMSNTYSRYIADATGDVELTFAKWQILISNEDITNGEDKTINITPTILPSENVAFGKLAPTSSGYFDIEIDPENVETSFNYTINIVENEDMTDLIITKYQILETEEEYELENGTIEGSFDYQNTEEFKYEKFTIRIFFEWYDGEDNQMTNEDDTNLVNESESISILTNISFEQKI